MELQGGVDALLGSSPIVGAKVGLITTGDALRPQQGAHFRSCLDEAEDIIVKSRVLFVTRGNAPPCEREATNAHASTELVHLPKTEAPLLTCQGSSS